jgi:phage tail sheath protein FI
MPETFMHGVEVVQLTVGARPIRTVSSSVIAVVGTAPDADAAAFPYDTPVLVTNLVDAAKLDTSVNQTRKGTLVDAVRGIFDQTNAVVVVVRVAEGAGATDPEKLAATLPNVIGSVDAITGQQKGAQAFLAAKSILGVAPRILIAPGFTGIRPEDSENPGQFLANPVVAALVPIAERLRAVVVADGPNTTNAAAITYRGDISSKRVYVVDPAVKVSEGLNIVVRPASPRVAGLIAKSDNERGFWWSPSNQVINGIVGVARAVDFTMGDATSSANLLNESEVATIIREDGYRLWGNRNCQETEQEWAFLSTVRIADMINDSLLQAHLWAVDRCISSVYVDEVVKGVNAYLRSLKARGAILGGTCWADPALNTPDQIQQGKPVFDFDFTPPYPAEHVTFRSRLVNDYVSELFPQ